MSRVVSAASAVLKYESVVVPPKPEGIGEDALAPHLLQISTIAPEHCDLQVPLPTWPSTSQCANSKEDGVPLSPEQEEQILNAFRLFDTNDSGFLDVHEMHSALFALGYLSDYRDDLSASAKLMNDLLKPGNDSRGVSKERFRDIMRGSLIEKGGMEEICMTYDAIVDMTLSHNFPGLSRNNLVPENYSASSVHQPAADNSAPSTETEPAVPVASTATTNSKAKNIRRGVFPMSPSVRRTDSTVGITFEKLRRTCQRFDVRLTDEELRRVIRETDRNRNGYVDKPEYIHVLKNSCWF
jgi:Ca2+-binding EF-hand superfamily protein